MFVQALKLFCLSLALLLISASGLRGQDKVLKKFHWGVTSLSASQWIPWIAKEAKLYEKYGMEADLVLLRGSGQSAQAIIGGSILGAPCTLTTVMGANLSGADLVTVAHTVAGVQSKLLVRPDIKKPDDLRGKRIAVSGFGSLGDFLERYIIKKHGMDPVKDVILLSIGNQPDRIFKLYITAWSTRPTFLIPLMFKPSEKGIASCGMPNRRSAIRRWRSSHGANMPSMIATASCAWSKPMSKASTF